MLGTLLFVEILTYHPPPGGRVLNFCHPAFDIVNVSKFWHFGILTLIPDPDHRSWYLRYLILWLTLPVLTVSTVVLKKWAALALLPHILTMFTDGTNLSTDGTENDDRGTDDTEGISSTSTHDLWYCYNHMITDGFCGYLSHLALITQWTLWI